jgi:hypothetical protein
LASGNGSSVNAAGEATEGEQQSAVEGDASVVRILIRTAAAAIAIDPNFKQQQAAASSTGRMNPIDLDKSFKKSVSYAYEVCKRKACHACVQATQARHERIYSA